MNATTLMDYWYILYNKKKTIYIIVLSSMISAVIFSYLIPKTYEAKSVFFIPKNIDNFQFFGKSDEVKRSILQPEYKDDVYVPYIGLLKSNTLANRINILYPAKPLGRFKRDVDFLLNNEYMLEVYVRDRNPYLAAKIANAYPEMLNEMIAGSSLEPTAKTLRSVESRVKDIRTKLEKSQEALNQFQNKNKAYYVSDEAAQLVSLKSGFIKMLDDSNVLLKETSREMKSVQKQIKKESGIYEPVEIIATSPIIEDLRKQIIDMEIKIASTKGELTEAHPTVVALKEQYSIAQANLNKEVDRLIKSQTKAPGSFFETLRQSLVNLNIKKDSTNERIMALKGTIRDADNRIKKAHSFKAKLEELTREVERNKNLYENLQLQLEEASAQQSREMQAVIIVDRASPSRKPIFPVLWLNMVVGGLLGLIFGVFFVFFLNYLDCIKYNNRDIKLEAKEEG